MEKNLGPPATVHTNMIIRYPCVECGCIVELDTRKIRCRKCLDKEARKLLKAKLGSRTIDPTQLRKALGIE
jgi:DNA-directed RNA polymerase subunit RPC12/RpoP